MQLDKAKLETDLTGEEGRRNRTYYDSLGFVSGGIGRLFDPRKNAILRNSEIDLMFANDIDDHTAAAIAQFPWLNDMPEPVCRAIVNMCFQMGAEAVKRFPAMIAALQARNWTGAKSAGLDSLWFKETPERATLVTNLFLCNN